jgi:hypothetical protein
MRSKVRSSRVPTAGWNSKLSASPLPNLRSPRRSQRTGANSVGCSPPVVGEDRKGVNLRHAELPFGNVAECSFAASSVECQCEFCEDTPVPTVMRTWSVIVGGLFIVRSVVIAYFGMRTRSEGGHYSWRVGLTALSSLSFGVGFVLIAKSPASLIALSIGLVAGLVARMKGTRQSRVWKAG